MTVRWNERRAWGGGGGGAYHGAGGGAATRRRGTIYTLSRSPTAVVMIVIATAEACLIECCSVTCFFPTARNYSCYVTETHNLEQSHCTLSTILAGCRAWDINTAAQHRTPR